MTARQSERQGESHAPGLKKESAAPIEADAKASLLSLPSELLLQLLDEPDSLQTEWKDRNLEVQWFTWRMGACARYTNPWTAGHHPNAMALSQTCVRLRELMLPIIWQELGLNTLEDLARARDGLRLFPERAEWVRRLEWSWQLNHPAYKDKSYGQQYPELEDNQLTFEPLELILTPPFRWPKQPLATPDECVETITEVTCRLVNLDTLLWTSPYLRMEPKVVDFLADKPVPLIAFQTDLGAAGMSDSPVRPAFAPYWKFVGNLEKLAIEFCPACEEDRWSASDVRRFIAYDDNLSGIEEYCKGKVLRDEEWEAEYGKSLVEREETAEQKLARYVFSEQQMAVAHKIIVESRDYLESLAVEPPWVMSFPGLAPYWVQLEECLRISASSYNFPPHQLERFAELEKTAHLGWTAVPAGDREWYSDLALWHLGAAAIRPAFYHLARHRKQTGPLTGEEVQTLADRPPVYPASLFYPCFKLPQIARFMANRWEQLVEEGSSERIVCKCLQCQAA